MTTLELLRQALVGRRVEVALHDPEEWDGLRGGEGLVTDVTGDNPDLYITLDAGIVINPRASDLDQLYLLDVECGR